MILLTKSDCMNVTDLNHTVRHIFHIVYVFSELLKHFLGFCVFNMSDQLFVGIVFSCFWLRSYKNIVSRYNMTIQQYFSVEESLK